MTEDFSSQQDVDPAVHPPPSPPLPPSDQNPSLITPPTLLHVSFNQDSTCCSAGTSHGFRIYTTDPFHEIFRRDFFRPSSADGSGNGGGGVGFVGMLFGCKTVAVVGGGESPQYPKNKVMIWDENQSRCIGDLSFRSEVVSVRLRRDRIVAVLLQRLFVYNLSDFKLVHQVDTFANPRGLCEVSQVPGPLVLACPGLQKGQVRVEQNRLKRIRFITAHDSSLSCIALTRDGCFLATSSIKGTLIRVFNTMDGSLLQEVRRGVERAEVHSLAFSPAPGWLAVSSEKGTIHIFSLSVDPGPPAANEPPNGPRSNRYSAISSLPFIKGVLPKYFSSEWSTAQFHLHEGTRYVVSFGHQKNTLLVLGMDGSFYRCEFDGVKGGEMVQLEYRNLFN